MGKEDRSGTGLEKFVNRLNEENEKLGSNDRSYCCLIKIYFP